MSERPKAEERPPAPWGSFPLAELVIFAGIVALIVGFVSQSPMAIGIGVALAGLGGLEVSIREHFAGYRSHTTLLAGVVFVVLVGTLLYFAKLQPPIAMGIGVAGFALTFFWFRRVFQRASGGLSFKVGRLRG